MTFGGKSYQENEFVKININDKLIDIRLDNFIRDYLADEKKGGKK